MDRNSKIYIAGHKGMVGSAILRKLESKGFSNFILKTSNELDLRDQREVSKFFKSAQPEYVIISAAKVGGILANNSYRGEFIYDNLMIQTNIIHSSHLFGVKKLLFLGSSCIYPKLSTQPMKEEYLLTGELEYTNEPYAISKISGIKMCESYYKQYKDNFISVMPTNLYGTNDNFDLESSHVLPALIRKFHEAKRDNRKSVEVWGTGSPKREFLHVDDLADACIFIFKAIEAATLYDNNNISHLNVGCGEDISIKELALKIADIVGFGGDILYDATKPDGTPRKLLDVTRLKEMGWSPSITLDDGIKSTYDYYIDKDMVVK